MRGLLLVTLLSACASAPNTSALPQGQGRVSGALDGFHLDAASAVYYLIERPGQDTPKALILVLTDLPQPCAALRQGIIKVELGEHIVRRPGVRTLSWMAIGGHAGGVFEPLAVGSFVLGLPPFEGPSPLPAPPGTPFAFPIASTSRAGDCESDYHLGALYGSAGASPRGASFDLTALEREPGREVAAGRFEIVLPSGTLAGSFRASYCPLPKRFVSMEPRCLSKEAVTGGLGFSVPDGGV